MTKMKKPLLELIFKYCFWAKFDWCGWVINYDTNKIQFIDNEEQKRVSQSYVIRHILENGMLDECFTKEELKILYKHIPPRFKNEIKYYLEMNENGK